MPVKTHPIAGKNYEGIIAGGEGKEHLVVDHEPEFKGVYRSAPNPKLHPEVGYTSQRDGSEDNSGSVNHVVGTTAYGGPQRFTPKSLGERHPDHIEHSS